MNIPTLFKSLPVFACSTLFCLAYPSVVQASPLSPSNHNKQISDKAMPTHETNGIRYQFAGCKQSGENLNCSVLLTTLTQDQSIIVEPRKNVRLIDFAGNQYSPKWIQLSDNGQRNWIKKLELVKDVPLKVILNFQGINTKVNGAALLQIKEGKLKNLSF